MSEQRNIVVVGASFGGLLALHDTLKHTLPALKAKSNAKHHIYLISPSSDFYFRVASPRTSASNDLLPAEKLFIDIQQGLTQYSENDVTFIKATATGLNTSARTVSYSRSEGLGEESLPYHALIIATGSRTHSSIYSMHTDAAAVISDLKATQKKVSSAKNIIVVGGGATGVESAGELGELLNGKPGWFSTPPRKVNITLLTAANQLLPSLRPAIGKQAEDKLRRLGVDVLYNTRVAGVEEAASGKTVVTLSKGERMEVDLYLPAHGVLPNSSWIPDSLLNPSGYVKTNATTLRVDEAGARVYAFGDVASYSRNTIIDIRDSLPVLSVNMKRDLMSFDPAHADERPKGKDREYKQQEKEMMIVPIGSGGGVGAVLGWQVPSWFVWLFKSRDFMIGKAAGAVFGDMATSENKWTVEESAL